MSKKPSFEIPSTNAQRDALAEIDDARAQFQNQLEELAKKLRVTDDKISKPGIQGGFNVDDVRAYGTLAQAVAAVSSSQSKTIFITGEQAINGNLTVPANISVVVLKGGSFTIANGITLTLNGNFASHVPVATAFTGAGSYVLGVACSLFGTGTPESAVAAPVGSVFRRTDGGASTVLYLKESGAGNTGWVAYASGAAAIDGSLTAGKIPKASDSNTLTDSIITEDSGRIGIGTTSPASSGVLHVVASVGVPGGLFARHTTAAAAPTGILFRRSRNTEASPTGLVDQDSIFILQAAPHDGSLGYSGCGYIEAYVDGVVTSGLAPPVGFKIFANITGAAAVVALTVRGSRDIECASTTDATSTTAAAFEIAGGLGVAKKVFVGEDIALAATEALIRGTTSDGSDNQRLTICAAGAAGSGRSGRVVIAGMEHADAGKVEIIPGAGSSVYLNGRVTGKKGSDVASASEITLGEGNYFVITGSTNIDRILSTGWTAGSIVVLEFSGSLSVNNEQGNSGSFHEICLDGATAFSATAADTLTLLYTGSKWREISRSVLTDA